MFTGASFVCLNCRGNAVAHSCNKWMSCCSHHVWFVRPEALHCRITSSQY